MDLKRNMGEGTSVTAPENAPDDWMTRLRNEPYYMVEIHNQEGHEGKYDVPVGVNGYVLLVKRGFKVEIGESFIKNLQDSKYDILSKDDDGNDVVTQIPRFSFSIISGPHQRNKGKASEQPVTENQVQAT